MAFKASFLLSLVLISNILFVTTFAARSIAENSNSEDKKEPQFLFKSEHGRVHIPGFGHVGFPHKFHLRPQNPFPGGNGGAGTGSGAGTGTGTGSPTGRSYVPGGDDTFVPNPGFEVPIPGSGGNVPAPIHP